MADIIRPNPWGAGSAGQPLFVPGTLRGYRLMTVVGQPEGSAFLALRGGWATWERPEMQAACLRSSNSPLPPGAKRRLLADPNCQTSPGDGCFCGLYHSYTPYFRPSDWPSFHWIVVAANWGRVIAGPCGFRSAKARLIAAAPRQGSLAYWTQFQSAAGTATWRKQRSLMVSFGLDIQPDLAALIRAYPPDDVTNLRPIAA